MKIAVIGTGHVGSALGGRFAEAGHEVMFGSRDPNADRVHGLLKQINGNARASTIDVAGGWGEVVVLATPWTATEEVLHQAGDLTGRPLIDCTNPIGTTGQLVVAHDISAGELVAEWTGAYVVKAFNAVGAAVMLNPIVDGKQASMFYCGDSVDAKAITAELASEIGFDPVDCGALMTARYLEPMALLWVQLAFKQGLGPETAFRLLKSEVIA